MSQDQENKINEEKQVFTANVIFFSNAKGYGFLDTGKKPDLFFHWSAIQVSGFKTLKQGQKVQFEIGKNLRNQDVAVNIVPINE